jgi:carbon storage regulator
VLRAQSEKGRSMAMLVLRRKIEESIVLSLLKRKMKITILAVEGERVKLGISAPPEVSIVREELLDNEASSSQDERKVSA